MFIFLMYFLALVFFSGLRLLFMLSFREQVAGAAVTEILKAFAIGVRFDQIVVLYVLLPLMLILPWIKLRVRSVRFLTIGYVGILFGLAFLLSLADVRFYSYFESHFNFLAYEYIGEGNMFWYLIVSDPKFYGFVALWLLLSVAFVILTGWVIRLSGRVSERRSWVGQSVWFALFIALSFLGIRGRTGLAPIDWGAAYFSENRFLNQMGLNGVYTLGRNLTERGGDLRLSTMRESERFEFVDFSAGLDTLQAMLYQPGVEWLDTDSSLMRLVRQDSLTPGFRPNVVLVLMESWSARNTGALGSRRGLTPHFDSIAGDGILFTKFYASGIRTSFGLPAVLGSYPSVPGRSIMGRYDAAHPFVTLSEILHERGYFNAFVYGGDLVFDNIEGIFKAKKYDRFFGESYFGPEKGFSKWGIPDHVLFEETVALMDSLPRPFQLTVLTLSNHAPWDLPDSSVQRYTDGADSSQVFNAQLYADHALGMFVRSLQSRPLLDSTILVFVSDHADYARGRYILDPEIFQIPLLLYGPALIRDHGREVEKIGSQTDVIPTLMGFIGGDYRHAGWGRDLTRLAADDPGFAVMNAASRIGCINGDLFYLEWLGRRTSLYDFRNPGDPQADIKEQRSEDFLRLQRRTRAFMQIAEQLSMSAVGK